MGQFAPQPRGVTPLNGETRSQTSNTSLCAPVIFGPNRRGRPDGGPVLRGAGALRRPLLPGRDCDATRHFKTDRQRDELNSWTKLEILILRTWSLLRRNFLSVFKDKRRDEKSYSYNKWSELPGEMLISLSFFVPIFFVYFFPLTEQA